jgi:hypothetical protein
LAVLGGSGLAETAPAAAPPSAGFERMKSLVGEWTGKSGDGKPVTISYALVSDGSALMEKLGMAHESDMVTLYHPDGDGLMMTHYCSAHNQPRMRAGKVSPESRRIAFDFLDATNLASPDAGHMHRLVVTFEDRNRIVQEWTWREKGKEKIETFTLERKK